jgi:hypothetical protein
MGTSGEGNRGGLTRGRVIQGRYGKMRDGSFSGNRWAVLEEEGENSDGRRSASGGGRTSEDEHG